MDKFIRDIPGLNLQLLHHRKYVSEYGLDKTYRLYKRLKKSREYYYYLDDNGKFTRIEYMSCIDEDSGETKIFILDNDVPKVPTKEFLNLIK